MVHGTNSKPPRNRAWAVVKFFEELDSAMTIEQPRNDVDYYIWVCYSGVTPYVPALRLRLRLREPRETILKK